MLDWLLGKAREEERAQGGGGGGRARIRMGNTGPRGRQYATVRGPRAVVKSKYIKMGKGSRPAIRAHLKYIQERERGEGEGERKFFDREESGIERKRVFAEMLENRGDRTAMHTLILSPGDNSVNMQEYTRESMQALEDRMGHKLDWYAVIHENTDHHHAHVVVAGKIPGWSREAQKRQHREQKEEHELLYKRPKWKNREQELKELLGDRYDEPPAQLDPREERRDERSRWQKGEQEPVDPKLKDLLDDYTRSPNELKEEKLIERYEQEMAARERQDKRREVFLDKGDLAELRSAGTDYVERERSMDRSLERAYEREFGRDRSQERTLERSRDMNMERDSFGEINKFFEMDRQVRQQERSIDRSQEREQRSRGDDEDRPRERDRGDFDRGR